MAALEAALADARARGCEKFVCLGDLTGYGDEAVACVELARKTFDVCLTVKRGRIVRVGLNRRGEILQRFDFMIIAEKIPDKQEWINPLPWRPLDGPVVEIVSIEIDVCSLYDSPLKLQGPQPKAEAPHRLDGVWRLDVYIIAKAFECKQVADFRKG